MINQARLINRFMELVQIDSLSREERAMADRLKAELLALGAVVREDQSGKKIAGNAGNLIADFSDQIDGPLLLLSAHMDRVEPGRGIKAEICGDYLVSQGETVLAGDDLIAVAAILEALTGLQEKGERYGRIKVVFTVAEEQGLLGAKSIDPEEIKSADYGIVFDLDDQVGMIVDKAPSQFKFNATIIGKSPSAGVDAIKIASKAISEMKLGRPDRGITANIGVIKGGKVSHLTADLVELEGETRGHSTEHLKKQIGHIKEVISKATAKYQGQVSFRIEKNYPGFELARDSDIIKLVEKSIQRLNLPLAYRESSGGSDANIFNQYGLPTVNLGIGAERVHSLEERVKIDNMIKLAQLISKIIAINRGND